MTRPDNGARSLHEFIVGNLFGMVMPFMGRIKSGSGLDIGSIELNRLFLLGIACGCVLKIERSIENKKCISLGLTPVLYPDSPFLNLPMHSAKFENK